MNSKIINIIVMFLIVATIVEALGVSPGRTTLFFEPNLEKEVKFTILNNEQKDLKLAIYAKGDLAGYVELPKGDIELKPNENSKELSYKIKLPADMEEPGLHGAEIVIREITIEKGQKDISIGAMQAVITQLLVYVPYPGKYIVAKLDIVEGKVNEKVSFFVPLINFGEEEVKSAKAEIIVMDLQNNLIDKVETDEQQVPAKGRAELSAIMNSSKLTPGISKVIAKITYDGFTTTAENAFYMKDFWLIPLDISVRDFTLGDIAKFNILVENIGNVNIKDADSLMLLDSKDGKAIANLKSVPSDFKAFEKKEILSYWDTKEVREGDYNGKIILRYEGKSDERGIRAKVGKNSIQTQIIGITGYAIKEEALSEASISPLWILVLILIIGNIGWFVFYFRKKGKENKEAGLNENKAIKEEEENKTYGGQI